MSLNCTTVPPSFLDNADLILTDLQIKYNAIQQGMQALAVLIGGRIKITRFCSNHRQMGSFLFNNEVIVINSMQMIDSRDAMCRLELDLLLHPELDIEQVKTLVTAFANETDLATTLPVPAAVPNLPEGEPTVRECFARMDQAETVKPIGSLEQEVAKRTYKNLLESTERKILKSLAVSREFLE